MTTATPAPAATVVDVEIPDFRALYEGAVEWDACGPVAGEVAIAALQGRAPDIGRAQAAIARDLAARDANGNARFMRGQGQSLANIAWDLQQQGFTELTVVPYSDTPDLAALHDLLKLGGLNKWPVILQPVRAYNLPDNEAGVNSHFVVSGGINSAKGYLLANGDTQTGIANAQYHGWPGAFSLPLNWATWATLVNAGISGAILVHPMGWSPAPPPPPPSTVAVERVTLDAWMAALSQSGAALGQSSTVLANMLTNMKAL